MITPLARQTFADAEPTGLLRQLGLFQGGLARVLDRLTADPSADYIEQTVSITGSVAVAHKLGRQPVGWSLVDITAAATVFRAAWDSKFITLTASAPCAVTLRVW